MEKITISKDFKGKIFFTSDTHWRHDNIIKYCDRPFVNVQEMDHALIQNWNKVVSEDDIVFHLGDFAFADKSKWRQIANALKGRKYLIQGNHDRSDDIPTECFEAVGDMMQVSIEYEGSWHKFLLSHRPFLCFEGMFKDTKQLFGHCHSRRNNTSKDAYLLKYLVNSYDVGVDNNNFAPISFETLLTKF